MAYPIVLTVAEYVCVLSLIRQKATYNQGQWRCFRNMCAFGIAVVPCPAS